MMTCSEPLISKTKFVSIIETIKNREDLVSKIDDICLEYRTLLRDDLPYSSNIIIGGEEEIVDLLTLIMKDVDTISWWIWEEDFGRNFVMGDFTNGDKNIDLSTAEKLYDYLKEVNFNAD